ncbi:MAG: radical SAM protein [Melioribacteraceae bacterium]|nr:radical SAM protein [Melioribacteraceae bacterium]MCF8353218.1 radical SAM protein [Melioribacteraceae bacterium]MCF8395609.1 radical SAM protein [Melioribacteraceae bacterium]MCF8418748.1 radical SAM protein [Melioribacteraceae bacterium]
MLPSFLTELSPHEFANKIKMMNDLLCNCRICPNNCNVDRTKNEWGNCRTSDEILVSSYGPHFGEEPSLVGTNGSGTIFFTSCNLNCVYCQNYDISQLQIGEVISVKELADVMIKLQNRGCHNLNLVTPTHFIPQIIDAIEIAAAHGFELPIVYNCGGYESFETIKMLEGIIDLYMPDIKYSSNANGLKYSGVEDYWEVTRKAVKEMHRQVGDLKLNKRGIAQKGLLVRHLVLPNDLSGSKAVINFITEEISKETYINIMDQYRPAFMAMKYDELSRNINEDEFKIVVEYAKSCGLRNIASELV